MAQAQDGLSIPNCAKGRGVATTGLWVRSAPDTTGRQLGLLVKGQGCTVWAKDGDWCIIQTDDGKLTGWAHSAYMTLSALTP